MASAASSKQAGWSRGWTQRQNKQFECALAVYDRETPDRWHNVSRYMGGAKSPDEVRRHFDHLLHDVAHIDAGRVPFPRYTAASSSPPNAAAATAGLDDGRSRCIKFQ